MVRDPQSGKYRRTRLFVLTLGYSRKSVRLLVFRSSSQTWAELHEKAFRRLGGVTRVVVLDNLREGVLTPDIYDPTLNPLYRDMLRHYGVVALPCRVADPDRKGKVESGVGHAQKTPLKGLRFESLQEAQDLPGSLGSALGRHAHPRHHQAAGRRHVRRRAAGSAAAARRAFPLLPIRRTHGASGRLRGSRSGLLRRAAGLDRPTRAGAVGCPGMSACWIHRPASYCASTCARRAAVIASKTKTVPSTHRWAHSNCCAAPTKPERRSARSAAACTSEQGRDRGAPHSWACCRWPRSTVPPASTMPAPPRWKSASCEYRFVRRYLERHPQLPLSLRQVDPLIRATHAVPRLHREQNQRRTTNEPH